MQVQQYEQNRTHILQLWILRAKLSFGLPCSSVYKLYCVDDLNQLLKLDTTGLNQVVQAKMSQVMFTLSSKF